MKPDIKQLRNMVRDGAASLDALTESVAEQRVATEPPPAEEGADTPPPEVKSLLEQYGCPIHWNINTVGNIPPEAKKIIKAYWSTLTGKQKADLTTRYPGATSDEPATTTEEPAPMVE